MDKFEEWFASQDFYTNMRFIHGDGLFIKDGEVYRVLPAQMAWEAWQSRQAEVEEKDKRILFLEMNIKYVLDHFYMNDLDKAMPRVYEDLEKALRGEHEA